MTGYRYEIAYGKHGVPVYRVHAKPLTGVRPIPESPFTGRSNEVFALDVDMDVLGDEFLPAYTRGDNSLVVATDSMKNFIFRQALDYDGATLEGFLAFVGRRFILAYRQVRTVRLTGREMPFIPAQAPAGSGRFAPSEVLFARSRDDYATATLTMTATDGDVTVTDHRCGRVGMQLMKTTGSSFTSFVRDGYTTLPERRDRPLFVYLDVHWRYTDAADALGDDPARYIPAEQVRDCAATVFHEFVSESIQHLVHEMGGRLLDRFLQLAEVSFAAQNRTRDPFGESPDDARVKVYSDPFPAFGLISLTMARDGGVP